MVKGRKKEFADAVSRAVSLRRRPVPAALPGRRSGERERRCVLCVLVGGGAGAAYLCGLLLEVLLPGLVALVSTSHFGGCLSVFLCKG